MKQQAGNALEQDGSIGCRVEAVEAALCDLIIFRGLLVDTMVNFPFVL